MVPIASVMLEPSFPLLLMALVPAHCPPFSHRHGERDFIMFMPLLLPPPAMLMLMLFPGFFAISLAAIFPISFFLLPVVQYFREDFLRRKLDITLMDILKTNEDGCSILPIE